MQINYRELIQVSEQEASYEYEKMVSALGSRQLATSILDGYRSGIQYKPTSDIIVIKAWNQRKIDVVDSLKKLFNTTVFEVGKSLPSELWKRPLVIADISSYHYKKELSKMAQGDNFIIREKGTEFPKCDKRLAQIVVVADIWDYPKTQQFVECDTKYIDSSITFDIRKAVFKY